MTIELSAEERALIIRLLDLLSIKATDKDAVALTTASQSLLNKLLSVEVTPVEQSQ